MKEKKGANYHYQIIIRPWLQRMEEKQTYNNIYLFLVPLEKEKKGKLLLP